MCSSLAPKSKMVSQAQYLQTTRLHCRVLRVLIIIAVGIIATLYTDSNCDYPIPVDNTISPPLNLCIVLTGIYGIMHSTLANCEYPDDDVPILFLYQDSFCMVPNIGRNTSTGCEFHTPGDAVPSLMLVCQNGPLASSSATSTMTVGASATSITASTTIASLSTSSVVSATAIGMTKMRFTSPRQVTSSTSSHSSSSSSSGTGGDGTSSMTTASSSEVAPSKPTTNASSGLGESNKIALGVPIAIGIPALVFALLEFCERRYGRGSVWKWFRTVAFWMCHRNQN